MKLLQTSEVGTKECPVRHWEVAPATSLLTKNLHRGLHRGGVLGLGGIPELLGQRLQVFCSVLEFGPLLPDVSPCPGIPCG